MGRGEEINRYKIFWVTLDPTEGSEIAKTRPFVIISPDELNRYLRTVIVAPMTTAQKKYPYRINCVLAGKSGNIALDQIRTVDKTRIGGYIGKLNTAEIEAVKATLLEMFC
jgi:mRNA interferase MazF